MSRYIWQCRYCRAGIDDPRALLCPHCRSPHPAIMVDSQRRALRGLVVAVPAFGLAYALGDAGGIVAGGLMAIGLAGLAGGLLGALFSRRSPQRPGRGRWFMGVGFRL